MKVQRKKDKRFPLDIHPFFVANSQKYVTLREGGSVDIPDEVYGALFSKLDIVNEVKKPTEVKQKKSPSIEEAPEPKKKVTNLLTAMEKQ